MGCEKWHNSQKTVGTYLNFQLSQTLQNGWELVHQLSHNVVEGNVKKWWVRLEIR
eukprot:UN21539